MGAAGEDWQRNVVYLASTPQLAQVARETCCLLCWWETNRTCHWATGGACLSCTAPAAPTLGVQLGRHWRGPPETRVSVTAAAVDGVATQYGWKRVALQHRGWVGQLAVRCSHILWGHRHRSMSTAYMWTGEPPGNTDYRAWPRTSCLPEHEVEEQARGQTVPLQISISPSPAVCCSQRPIIDWLKTQTLQHMRLCFDGSKLSKFRSYKRFITKLA